MKAKIKFYDNIFDAVDDKNGSFQVIYDDTKLGLFRTIHAIEKTCLVTNVYIDYGDKKKEEETA